MHILLQSKNVHRKHSDTIQIKDLKNPFVILRNHADICISAIWLADHLLVQTPAKSFCMTQFAT